MLRGMTVDLEQKHPDYRAYEPDWELMRDAYRGERVVKTKGTRYLPYTSSQIEDGAGTNDSRAVGNQAYNAYRMRARFSNFVRESVQMAIGMMHSQPAEFILPSSMEQIKSARGESLQVLLRRIHTEQLVSGRIGLFVDLPQNPPPDKDMPYIATYLPERIINWDSESDPEELNLVILNETEYERKADFTWETERKHRVLVLGEARPNELTGRYRQALVRGDEQSFSEQLLREPSWRGRTLDYIPFFFANSCDITSDVDEPPLLDLANMCMTLYRMSADYHQNLFMQGQDTFVTIGGAFDEKDRVRTGAGARLDLPENGDAKYVGVTSQGLTEQREALIMYEQRAGTMGSQTLDSVSRERESGDSLKMRVAARTADLHQVADAGALALEHALKACAEFMGENPDSVEVRANHEFGEMPLTGQTMVEMATARNLGFPISAKSMHELAKKRRMTTLTLEEEMAAAREEEAEDHPFKKAESGDRAGAEQNQEGQDTDQDQDARAQVGANRGDG